VTRADALLAACGSWLAAGLFWGGLHAWTLVPPLAVYAALVLDGILRPAAPWFLPVLTHGDRTRPMVALTFDDGPDPQVTPQVLDTLRRHRARATFFLIGASAAAHPALVRRIVAEGHEIGNHSHAHPRLINFFPTRRLQSEIERASLALRRLTGIAGPLRYRPPMGLKNPWLARVQRRLGLQVVSWSLHARDTGGRPPESIAARVLSRVRSGDIVLLHDGHDLPGRRRENVVQALDLILEGLAARQLEPVPVGRLLPAPATASRRPADSVRETT